MNKIIYSILCLSALPVASCSGSNPDPIVVETKSYTYGVNVSVNTADAYGDAGSDLMEDYLSGHSDQYVGVMAYLYDADGSIVGSAKSKSSSATATQSLAFSNLDEGQYTLVTIQTTVDADYASSIWTISGTDQLSTLAIATTSAGNIPHYYCISTATKTVTVSGGDSSVSVSLQLLGSIVEVEWENFGNTACAMMGLFVDSSADTYKFDPSLSSSEKYEYEYYNDIQAWNPAYLTYDSDNIKSSGSENVYIFRPGEYKYFFGLSTT